MTAQHHHLVAEHHDLRSLERPAAAQQDQPAKDLDARREALFDAYTLTVLFGHAVTP